MGIFKKKNNDAQESENDPLKEKFDAVAEFVEILDTEKDFDKAIEAMKLIFKAKLLLRDIKTDNDVVEKSEFILTKEKEVKKK